MLLNSPIRLLVALALTATLVVSQDPIVPKHRCPENQQWYPSKPCLQLCGVKAKCSATNPPGCACKPGYTKQTPDSPCIPEKNCIICEGLKVYTPCQGLCPPSCQRRFCPSLRCIKGCICRDGLVLHNGECIPRSQCPAIQQNN
eukprot:XP_017951026.1 PREDICTED: otogelin-like protein [Xenopus tropicalis]